MSKTDDYKNAPPKTFWDECDYMILWNQNADKLTWDDVRSIAVILNEKYPRTDVLSLTDAKLLDMMREAAPLDKLPEISEDKRKDYLFAIKCALSREIEGDWDYNARQGEAEL